MKTYQYKYCRIISNNGKEKLLYSHVYKLHDEMGKSKTVTRQVRNTSHMIYL